MRKAVSTPNTFGNLCSAAGKVTHIESWVFAEPKEHLSRLVEAAKPFWPTTWTCGYIVDTFHVRQASELQLERFAFFLSNRSGLEAEPESADLDSFGWQYGHNRFHHRFGAHSLLFIATF